MATALVLPRLEGAPFVLRPFHAGDTAAVREAGSDVLIPEITSVPKAPADSTAVQAFIARQHDRASSGEGYSFAIAEAAGDVCVGQVGLWPLRDGRASIGYWVVDSARRRGVATRALQVASAWGLTLPGLHRLELYVEPRNTGSWRAAELSGYAREGLLRSWQTVGNHRRDMFMYSCLRPEPNN